MIVSTSENPTPTPSKSHRIILVVDNDDDRVHGFQRLLASALESHLSTSSEHQPEVFSLSQIASAKVDPNSLVVFLADLDKPLLPEMSDSTFSLVKSWLQQSNNLLWVTFSDMSSELQKETPYPYAGLKDGLLRTVRAEFSAKHLVSLTLSGETRDVLRSAKYVLDVIQSAMLKHPPSPETEYIIRDGNISIGRLAENVTLTDTIAASFQPAVRTESWLPGPPLKLDISTRGQLDTLHFKEDTDYHGDLGPMEVEIEARAWAVNFRDVFSALGRLDEDGFGSDCAGIVTRTGPQCQNVRVGDRICMCIVDCMRAYPRGNEWAAIKIPDTVSFEEACAVINPGLTSWRSLIEVARIHEGEKVLIHSAAGATGQVAVQIAQMIGAEVFATVGHDNKRQCLMDEYGIPADHIFYSRNTTFAKGIMRMTNGYGVDVVLNSLVGENLRASWECVAPYGRFVEIGKADINSNSSLGMGAFSRNVTFTAVDLRHIFLHRQEMGKHLLTKVMAQVEKGHIRYPKPLNIYDVSAVEGAFRYLQSGKNMGRIIIRVEPSTKVQVRIALHRLVDRD